jgi:type IV secretory pathway VirJ component
MSKPFTFILLCFLISGLASFSENKELPLKIKFNGENNTPLIFHITGDGGMVRFDLKMLKEYQNNGFSYIGLNSLKYFITGKTPEKVARDITPVIKHYAEEWDKETIMLVGFSFGAEIIPFLYNRLSEEMIQEVKLVVLLTPAKTSQFRIRLRDMIGVDKKKEPYDVADETSKIKSTRVLAVYGKEEKPSLKKTITQPNLKILLVKGGHGFNDSKEVFRLIKGELQLNN